MWSRTFDRPSSREKGRRLSCVEAVGASRSSREQEGCSQGPERLILKAWPDSPHD